MQMAVAGAGRAVVNVGCGQKVAVPAEAAAVAAVWGLQESIWAVEGSRDLASVDDTHLLYRLIEDQCCGSSLNESMLM